MSEIVVVLSTCTKSKAFAGDYYLPAWEAYYPSQMHKATVELVQQMRRNGDEVEWWILSAKYGFLRENDLIQDYDQYLRTVAEAKALAATHPIPPALKEALITRDKVVWLLSPMYERFFVEAGGWIPVVNIERIDGTADQDGRAGSAVKTQRIAALAGALRWP